MYNIVFTLKARYDLNCVESAFKPQPTNPRVAVPHRVHQVMRRCWKAYLLTVVLAERMSTASGCMAALLINWIWKPYCSYCHFLCEFPLDQPISAACNFDVCRILFANLKTLQWIRIAYTEWPLTRLTCLALMVTCSDQPILT